MKKELKITSSLFSGIFYIAAGVYGLALTAILASSLIPLYLMHCLALIAGFQILKKKKWPAILALLLSPLMVTSSISTLYYSLELASLSLTTVAFCLTLIIYTAFTIISFFLIAASWKEFK
ncbi:hypothetical protein KEJ50_05375 [Candidatus Bathyarchaeota archaeon]|nr:hypothetical protein [Candidatus Bathyarchaeota archaeon]